MSTSLDGSRRITVQSNLLHTEKSLLDLYAKRDTYECDFPGISNLNFIQLSSSFCKGKLGIARRKTDVVVKLTLTIHQTYRVLHMAYSANTSC